MCGDSDIGFYFNPLELDVEDRWSSREIDRLMQLSPTYIVKYAKIPTMSIEGEENYKCLIEQAEQMYSALRVMWRLSMLVRHQDDSREMPEGETKKHARPVGQKAEVVQKILCLTKNKK